MLSSNYNAFFEYLYSVKQQNKLTLKSQLSHVKDRIPTLNQPCTVYRINCSSCPMVYIGETERILQTSMNEHNKINMTLVLAKFKPVGIVITI